MDQGIYTNNPPSTSYHETFRRHRKLFCLPIILGALAAALFLFGSGKTYKSTASLWVDTAAPVPSSVGASATSLAEPPAVAEQAILNELLATRAFAGSVARTSFPGRSLSSADAEKLLGSGRVVGTTPGSQVLQVTYSASSPAVAESVLGAVITQLRNYTARIAAQHSNATVAYDRESVNAAEKALATARRNVTAYQAQHPRVTPADPNYASLVAAVNNATTQLAQANTLLSQDGKAQGWSIQVTDSPSQALTTPLGKKKIAELVLGGALAGLLVSFLAIVALTPTKKETWEDELPIGRPLVPDVPPADPFIGGPLGPDMPLADPFRGGSPGVPKAPAQSTRAATAAERPRVSLGDWGFRFRSPSARTEKE